MKHKVLILILVLATLIIVVPTNAEAIVDKIDCNEWAWGEAIDSQTICIGNRLVMSIDDVNVNDYLIGRNFPEKMTEKDYVFNFRPVSNQWGFNIKIADNSNVLVVHFVDGPEKRGIGTGLEGAFSFLTDQIFDVNNDVKISIDGSGGVTITVNGDSVLTNIQSFHDGDFDPNMANTITFGSDRKTDGIIINTFSIEEEPASVAATPGTAKGPSSNWILWAIGGGLLLSIIILTIVILVLRKKLPKPAPVSP